MFMRSPRVLTTAYGSEAVASPTPFTENLFKSLLGPLESGELTVETPGGTRFVLVGQRPGPRARLTVHSWRLIGRLASSWDLGFADSYMAGEWSSPILNDLMTLICHNESLAERRFARTPRFWLGLRHALNRNTRRGSRRNISAHYDLGNDFYERWLDAGMSYSSGLFSSAGQSLEQAQEAKIERVLDFLEARDGDRVLEIGCGWGSFAERLLERRDCTLTGLTLSANQLHYAKHRLRSDIAAGRCDMRLQDYRDVSGTFDRIVSIEMLEAVGEAYWSRYFEKLRQSLCPAGIAVVQAITIDERRFDEYRRRPDFIQKHIFPGGMLPTKAIIEKKAVEAGLEIVAEEFFGAGYARTLEQWKARFDGAWPEIKALGFDERFKRMWDYYLAYCQVGFEVRALDVGLYKLVRSAS